VRGTITRFVYDQRDLLAEYSSTGTVLARYTHGPGMDEPLAVQRGSVDAVLQTDALGSVVRVVDRNGAVVTSYTYDSFGRTENITGSVVTPFAFQGRELDSETGLYYYRARYYDPQVGRFMSEDPISFAGGVNLYTFAFNNPVNLLDPLGLKVGFGESLIPIWGSARMAAEDFKCGRWGWGIFNTAMAISDVFLVKSLATAAGKALIKGAGEVAVREGGEVAARDIAQVTLNRQAGQAAERLVADQLVAEGYEIVGSQVAVRTSEGLRYIDHLVRTPTGELIAVEVKSGGATRSAAQVAKDTAMASEGGRIVGKNAPDALRGQTVVIPTVERRVP
jgi:RHS repeat-associated protein